MERDQERRNTFKCNQTELKHQHTAKPSKVSLWAGCYMPPEHLLDYPGSYWDPLSLHLYCTCCFNLNSELLIVFALYYFPSFSCMCCLLTHRVNCKEVLCILHFLPLPRLCTVMAVWWVNDKCVLSTTADEFSYLSLKHTQASQLLQYLIRKLLNYSERYWATVKCKPVNRAESTMGT